MQAVLSLKEQFGHEVHEATCDQCQFGLQVEGRAARKRTHWATNARCIAQRLEVRCCGGHEHHDLTGNTARHAERYPRRLGLTILRDLREERISEGRLGSLELGQPDDEPEVVPEEGDPSHAPHGHGDDGATSVPTTIPWSPCSGMSTPGWRCRLILSRGRGRTRLASGTSSAFDDSNAETERRRAWPLGLSP